MSVETDLPARHASRVRISVLITSPRLRGEVGAPGSALRAVRAQAPRRVRGTLRELRYGDSPHPNPLPASGERESSVCLKSLNRGLSANIRLKAGMTIACDFVNDKNHLDGALVCANVVG
jgi:hypothetical protein